VWSGIMRTGDVMHIPRGYWHQATRTDRGEGYSLHVTFGFVKRTGVDWLTWLADRSREQQPFRHDLARWGEPDALADQQQDLISEVSRLLASYTIADYLAVREQERPPPRQMATHGAFGPPTAVVCVSAFRPHVEHRDQTIVVFAGGKKITFADKADPVLTLLLSGHPVDLAEATATTGVDAAAVAEPLIKEGVCAELTEALSSGCTGLVPTGTCSNTP
jgi:hypothetical protein